MFAFAAAIPDLRGAELADALAATVLAVVDPAMSSVARPKPVGRHQRAEVEAAPRPPGPPLGCWR